MSRCEDLWTSEGSAVKSSFVALYFSVLSLGALVGPRSEELIGGQDNLAWSRKFFDESRTLCSALGMVTDLEMVQCYFFLVRPLKSHNTTRSCPLTRGAVQSLSKRVESALYVCCYASVTTTITTNSWCSVTYMYVGLAVRTALAIGINRSPPEMSKKDLEVVKAETRTWWYAFRS